MVGKAALDHTAVTRNVKRKSMPTSTPSPPPLLKTKGLRPMLDGDVLHPFAQQSAVWDDLWLEQDNGRALREFTVFHRDN